MKITEQSLKIAVAKLATIPFFPLSAGSESAVRMMLAEMVPNNEALTWLVDTAIRQCKTWPGMSELRGLLCWKYAPLDGQEGICSIPGFTPADGEAKSVDEHQQLKSGGWIGEANEPKRLPGCPEFEPVLKQLAKERTM